MLRVGLTGGLGSGKSTVARMFARYGVHILEADQIGRELMHPGQPIYQTILEHFRQYPDAPPLTHADGELDRPALARYVFSTNRLNELSRIIHPPVILEQERRMEAISCGDPRGIVMVESALIFEADRAGTAPGLSHRFDKLILVTAPEEVRIARYVSRASGGKTLSPEERTMLEDDAKSRMRLQISDAEKASLCDFAIENSGSVENIEAQVQHIFKELQKLDKI